MCTTVCNKLCRSAQGRNKSVQICHRITFCLQIPACSNTKLVTNTTYLKGGLSVDVLDLYADTMCTSFIGDACPSWEKYWTQIISSERLNSFPPYSIILFNY